MQECITELKPLFLEKTAICFVCDDKFVPYFSVALESLYRNSDKNKEYDIIVLESDISKDNKCNFESYNTNKYKQMFVSRTFFSFNGNCSNLPYYQSSVH